MNVITYNINATDAAKICNFNYKKNVHIKYK
jgi:hypothetical protein